MCYNVYPLRCLSCIHIFALLTLTLYFIFISQGSKGEAGYTGDVGPEGPRVRIFRHCKFIITLDHAGTKVMQLDFRQCNA